MKPRQRIVELFSTFIQFADDLFERWVIDSLLQRSIQRTQQSVELGTAESAEHFWVLYWYRLWQTNPESLAMGHLSAYLQEACYWVAKRVTLQLTSMQYQLSDCFQIAITSLPIVLKGYNPKQGASIKTYASIVFSNKLRDTLRQQREAESRTNWGLLRKLSQKQLVESLEAGGLSEVAIASYCLAWTCFKTCCAPSEMPATRQLSEPDGATWVAIAQLYNTQRLRQTPPRLPEAQPETLECWLKKCAQQSRAYLYPAITSLNLNKSESGSGELIDDLPDRAGASGLNDLMIQEELQEQQTRQTQINAALKVALEELVPQLQTLLELYYTQGLTQQQIAAQLAIKQYTVSRRLSSAKEKLLLALAKWSQEMLHISLTSTAVKDMGVVLEEWLQEKLASGSSKEGSG
ncbi:MAG TPA: group 3/4 sigma-70 RNA polymerase sigma factor [Cyanobacteria bacterium UBA8803]|nr:group 3/4 sigma-70 RNA polymerase sigma factor [Cyanobacteria bacterium UBA9273]HBL60927.1 group 3/4 sigma-70 RNA polymerase sigma factor [Cyanobacteria bacterium UBA8803]